MINAEMRLYNYHLLGAIDTYGQPQLSENMGLIKMAISNTSNATQDNILYKDASYIGVTHAPIDDSYIIQYGEEKLKVLHVTKGRYNIAFLGSMA